VTNEPHVFCLYCDDIRHEINGKVSLIGVYQGGMNVHGATPQVLPQLVVSVFVSTPIDRPLDNLCVEVMLNDLTVLTTTPPAEALQEMKNAVLQDNEASTFSIQMVFVLQPFQVSGSGKLWVRLSSDGKTYSSNPLQIKVLEAVSPKIG